MKPIDIVVVGVDPAPKKGLCVYAHDLRDGAQENAGFDRHYPATVEGLQAFAARCNDFNDRAVLICWDAPLTMPSDFFRRDIEMMFEEICGTNPNTASVQAAAQCPHWVITQKLLGFPGFNNQPIPNALLNTTLVFSKDEIRCPGLYLTEVHPALAMQFALGRDEIGGFGPGGKLSGNNSYKDVVWNPKNENQKESDVNFNSCKRNWPKYLELHMNAA